MFTRMTIQFLIFLIACPVSGLIYAQNIHPKEKFIKSLEWRHIGPYRGGRSCAVTGLLHNRTTYFMGSTGGGVWKTVDAGNHWENISDGYFGGSIGSVAVSDSDPNILWVGTGEQTVRGNVSPGAGIWKSEDGGKSWKLKGLEFTRHISRIRIHPKNPDVVYVAALGDLFKNHQDRGVFKTSDGGKTWKKCLFLSDSAGVVDLVLHPTLPNIIYANVWNVRRTPYSLISGGPESSMWMSRDGGEKWENMKGRKGLPKGLWGISCLSLCQSNPDILYAVIENENGGLFRSDDAGTSWHRVNESRDIRQRAWYFSRLQVDPKDPNSVYVLNVSLHKSKDGGKSFQTIPAGHADYHDLWIDPNDPVRMILANDGGAQVTENGGQTWSSQYNQPTAQFYRITTDNHFPFRIYAAQQDNSTIRISHRNESHAIGQSDWEGTAGGESGHIAVDPLNPDIVYGGSYGGYLTRYDHKNNWSRNVHVWPDNPIGHGAINLKYRFQWNFPILFSRHNPKKLFACSNHVHVTYSEGQKWTTLSPDLTRNDTSKMLPSGGPITHDNTSVEYYCTIFAIAESYLDSNVIWTGSDDGLIHLTKDGGKNWINVTPAGLPKWAMVNSIEADPFDPGACYIAATSYKSGDYSPGLWKTEDFGNTWKKIDKGINSDHFTRVLRADPIKAGLLYCGTERGVYFSEDGGKNWYSLQLNLPIVPVTDLAIKDHILIASTQGRSIWTLDDLTPLRNLGQFSEGKNHFLHPKPAYSMRGTMDKKVKRSGINHPSEFMLFFYLDSLQSTDTLEFYLIGKSGDTITRISNKFKKGFTEKEMNQGSNLILLPIKYQDAYKVDGMILWGGSLAGPLAPPGKYDIRVNHNRKEVFRDTVSLIRHLGYPSTDSDAVRRFAFLKKCRDKVDESHRLITRLRDIRNQQKAYFSKFDSGALSEEILRLRKEIDSLSLDIENKLYQTKMQAVQDPINYPIKLVNKLAHLIALYNQEVFPPTDQAEELSEMLIKEINQQIDRTKSLEDNQMKKMNTLLRQISAPFFLTRDPE